ncbi:MAG TPA: cytochrome c biogenesis protein CcsA [Candidatus Eisenbacteria bacterium]|nr:cytochrome c biogenesis protein CcsA [Candidatus Eisenbacteria bacterium]
MRGVLGWAASAAMLVTLYLIFCVVPTEAEMGIVQRIFYFHVPCAWVAFAGFFTVAGASAVYLWKGWPGADHLAVAAAEVGVLFCTLVLVTGPIWARPIWGVWWTWDPRLTMTVILWAIYVAYLMLRAFGGEGEAVARYAAVLGIVGVIDIPVIHYAVRLLEGIHPSVLTQKQGGGSGLVDPMMRTTLYVASVTMLLVGGWLVALRVRTERLAAEVAVLRREVEEGGGV